MKQEALRERLLVELDLLMADVAAVASPLTAAQLNWKPGPERWSIGQLLEHVVVGAGHYLHKLRPLIYQPGAPLTRPAENDWSPTFTAWLLVASLKSQRRWHAPPLLRIGPEPRAEVLKAFQAEHAAIHALLLAAADLDWNRLTFRSPVNAFFRLNLGDAFSVLVVHGQRHALQMQRVRELPGFGKG